MKKIEFTFNSLPVFPIPIGVYNFKQSNHNLNQTLVSDTLLENNNDSIGEDHSNMGGWHSKVGMEQRYQSYSNLCDILSECGNHYCNSYGYKDGITCFDLWANINQSGDVNFMHHHGTTALAGVYYPASEILNNVPTFNYTNENPIKAGTWNNIDGGALVLQDPSYGRKVGLLTKKATPYNIDFYHLYPTASVLVLFPSYLLHMVLPFKENKTRMSISFAFSYGTN